MTDITNWDYYYNLQDTEWGIQKIRANLVYTPRVSLDKKTFCLDFNRDTNYHFENNELWTPELLEDRFRREINSYNLVKDILPVLKIKDIEEDNRRVFIEWHGDDFYMQGFNSDYSKVLPDWEQQWLSFFKTLQNNGLYKISLHPNSFTVHDGQLIPFNWFFTYEKTEPKVKFTDLLIQISSVRQEKLEKVLETFGVKLDTPLELSKLQLIALNSFRTNYPSTLIDEAIKNVL